MRVTATVYCTLMVLFLLAPVIILVPMSFGSSIIPEFPPRSFSLDQYRDFLSSGPWMDAVFTSVRVAIAAMIAATVLGTMASFALVRGRFFGKTPASAIMMAPRFVPIIITALAFYALFAQLRIVGTELALVIAHTIIAAPYVLIIVSATLRGFDRSLERAAQSLGASPFRAVLGVTIPLIKSGVVSAALISFIVSFDEIVIAIFISGTRAVTLPKKMWDSLVFEMEPTLPAVSTLILLSTLFLFVLAAWARRGAKRLHQSTRRRSE